MIWIILKLSEIKLSAVESYSRQIYMPMSILSHHPIVCKVNSDIGANKKHGALSVYCAIMHIGKGLHSAIFYQYRGQSKTIRLFTAMCGE